MPVEEVAKWIIVIAALVVAFLLLLNYWEVIKGALEGAQSFFAGFLE